MSLVINYDLPKKKKLIFTELEDQVDTEEKGVSINFVTDRDLDHQNSIQMHYDTKIEEMPQNINDYLNI